MNYGIDALGGVKFAKVVASIPASFGLGIFWDTFDPAKNLIIQEAKRRPFIRVQGIWSDTHTFTGIDQQKARVIAAELQKIALTSSAKIYYSPYCEDKLSTQSKQGLFAMLQPLCPNVTLVNTPLPQGGIMPAMINEMHGGGKPRSPINAFSFDGTGAEDSDVEAVKAAFPNSEYFMIWGPRCNGRWEDNDPTPRPQRKGWPDAKYMRSLEYLATDKGPASLPKNWLWKSHSENKGKGDPRAEKPVAIVPIKAKSIELKQGAKTVASLPYYGPYANGGFRYYADKWGYEIGKVDVWIGNKKYGNINAGFRDPTFR